MSTKQIVALVAPLVLVGTMIPVFRALAKAMTASWRLAWYLGLVLYWLTWCGILPLLLVGRTGLANMIRPQRLTISRGILALVPVIGASLYRLVPGMYYEKPSLAMSLLILSTCLGNGFFEELLWRGMYLHLFPKSLLLGVVWPTIWFGLWHYAPGAINPDGNPLGLMIGSAMMGGYLGFLSRQTGTIWWCILGHTLGGVIMIG